MVTGSTSGIGLGIATALAGKGCNVMLNGFGDIGEIEAQRRHLAEAGEGGAEYSPADMRKPDEIAAMIEQARQSFGSVDILVNNAGIQHVSPITEFPLDKWDDIIAINLSSAFHTLRAALPLMEANGWGRVVNIASAHALVASPFKAAYVAAKHGIAGLTKTVALEMAAKGITVNAIAPGYVKTPLVEGQIADTTRVRGISEEEVVRDVMLLAQPTREMISIDDVAAMALYLCSNEARGVTGTILSIDGGWTAK